MIVTEAVSTPHNGLRVRINGALFDATTKFTIWHDMASATLSPLDDEARSMIGAFGVDYAGERREGWTGDPVVVALAIVHWLGRNDPLQDPEAIRSLPIPTTEQARKIVDGRADMERLTRERRDSASATGC